MRIAARRRGGDVLSMYQLSWIRFRRRNGTSGFLRLPSSHCIFCFLADPCLNGVFILLGLLLAISLYYYLNFLTSFPICQIPAKSSLTNVKRFPTLTDANACLNLFLDVHANPQYNAMAKIILQWLKKLTACRAGRRA